MKRIESKPRADWAARLENVGIDYHTNGQSPSEADTSLLWWDESVAWELTSAEVDALDDATKEIHQVCLGAVDHIINKESHLLTEVLGLPEWMADYASKSWKRGDPALMGRMDLAVSPDGDIKFIEYNGDTPTLAIETAVAQWQWLEEVMPGRDQFNSLHERILMGFQRVAALMGGRGMHFTAFKESPEEWAHSTYFRDLAEQAGIPTRALDLPEVRWNPSAQEFRDEEENVIRFLHKLYPWENIMEDEFGQHFAMDRVGVIEPPWKLILGHKALLPILYRLYPNHPNLLESHLGPAPANGEWVEKPVVGRGGSNIRFISNGHSWVQSQGGYGDYPVVSQRRASVLNQDGWTTLLGSWVAADEPCGIIFRESRSPILGETDRVVPHFFI
jgi:glutathionylspermidine synthase